MYDRELNTAIKAVREAATLCARVQSQIDDAVLEKNDKSPVTIADFASQALVCSTINEAFPDDPIIAEEDSADLQIPENTPLLVRITNEISATRSETTSDLACRWIDFGGADRYTDRFWTLDPIDGTKGFLRTEQYAIALALIVEGQVTVAALACPNLITPTGEKGAVFSAIKGQGTFLASLTSNDAGVPIHVTRTQTGADARFCESVESGHSSHDDAIAIANAIGITNESVRIDSQAKYGVVASGMADIYMRLPTRKGYVERIWDHAAGVLVVEEAGGKATDITGAPLDFTHGKGLETNRGVIVTNGHLHDDVLSAIAQRNLVG